MANTQPKCKQCEYNTPKTKGGLGRICNGYTQEKYGRCPQWRIDALIKAKGEAENRRIAERFLNK